MESNNADIICPAQEQALRTNYVKFHVDKSVECATREVKESPISLVGKLAQKWIRRDTTISQE